MNIQETMEYIHAVGSLGSRPGLSRIEELCRRLCNPEEGLRFIHVGGTNGKGSVSSMLSSVLQAAGYRVGLYTSPYLYDFRERMQHSGVPIGEEALCRIMDRVKAEADRMDDRPTEFELITAAALLWFKEEGCDPIILEVGLGGRLDATNIIKKSLLSLITGISLDHTSILGDTEEAIAKEKAGIFKTGCPALVGEVSPAVKKTLSAAAKEKGTPLSFLDLSSLSIKSAAKEGIRFRFEKEAYSIPFAALYQPKNASLVLKAIDLLKEGGLSIPDEAIKRGLASVYWPGRFEYFCRKPEIVYDGSHNPEGVKATVQTIKRLYKKQKIMLITGVMADKDYNAIVRSLAPLTDTVFTVTPDNPRSLSAEALCAAYRKEGAVALPRASVKEALTQALPLATAFRRPIFILGSLYLYKEAKDAFAACRDEGLL